jgi:hypothetical protein
MTQDIAELLGHYLKTEYRVETGGGIIVLKINQPSDFLGRAHKLHITDRSAFITACNPASLRMNDAVNEAAMEAMNDEISERWPKYFSEDADPTGAWPPEPSFLVMGIDYRDVIKLAHKYNQNAFLYAYKEPVLRLYYRDSGSAPNKYPYGYKPYFAPNRKVEALHVNFITKTSAASHALSEKAQALIAYVEGKGFVCPSGKYWDGLWKLLPDKGSGDTGWKLPAPLILSGWHFSDHHEKGERFMQHIAWADKKGVIDQADIYLRDLRDDCWLTLEEGQRQTEWLKAKLKRLQENPKTEQMNNDGLSGP